MDKFIKKWAKSPFSGLLKHLKNNSGATLIELIVTFMIMVIFMTGSCQIISSSLKVYYQMRNTIQLQEVSDTIMEKVTGDISGALTGVSYEGNTAAVLKIQEKGQEDNNYSWIDFYDKTGSHICITTQDERIDNKADGVSSEDNSSQQGNFKEMRIYYYPVVGDKKGNTESKANAYEDVNWTFDKKMYLGYEINSLDFSLAGNDYPKNVIKVELTLKKKGKDGVVSKSTRYVECYNFTDESNIDNLIECKNSDAYEDPPNVD